MSTPHSFLVVVILLGSGTASAQSGHIGIFDDPGGAGCAITDVSGPLTIYHVVHVLTPAATRARFSAPLPSCHAGTYVGDVPSFPATFGNSQTGIEILYPQCMTGPVHLLEIWVMTAGTTPTGCTCCWATLPDPNAPSGRIEVFDCSSKVFRIDPFGAYVNPDIGCGSTPFCDCFATVPTESSTWGRVKALYLE
ncbi:MAG: hypothetical protein ACE5EO_10045 [Candidatus Krumholzibacteriia bacterium]